MKAQSGAWLPRDRVIAAAEETITNIRNMRIKRKADLDARKASKRWWQMGPSDMDYDSVSCYGWGTESVAEDLLDLARATSEPLVFVTREDFRSISNAYQS